MSETAFLNVHSGERLQQGLSDSFDKNDVGRSVKSIVAALSRVRRSLSGKEWRAYVEDFRARPECEFVQKGPLTSRAFYKPRGYPGDAEMLDLLYASVPLNPEVSDLGKKLYFEYEFPCASGRSVRARRDLMTAKLDELGHRRPGGRVLAVACGHLREAQHSLAVQERKFKAFYALDQDQMTLGVVEREQAADGISPIQGSVRSLLSGKVAFDELDFIYAMGLFDYLEDGIARALIARLFSMLRAEGRLLVANFAPSHHEIGYMEAAMDWWLKYRDEEDMKKLISDLQMPHRANLFRDVPGNLVFLEIARAG